MSDTISHIQVRGGFSSLSFKILQPPPLPFYSSSFSCCCHPIFGNSHFRSFSVNISLLWASNAFSLLLSAFFPRANLLALFFVPSHYLSLPPVLLSQYLYAAPLCNTSLIHTLLHPPSPPFRSHTINAEKRAQTEVTCTENIKELRLNLRTNSMLNTHTLALSAICRRFKASDAGARAHGNHPLAVAVAVELQRDGHLHGVGHAGPRSND